MPLENGMRGRNLGLDRNFLLVEIEVDDAIDQLKVIKDAFRLLQAFLAATSSSIRAQRFFRTK